MPTLADIDDPRPSRARGFLIGTAVAVPFGILFLWFVLNVLPKAILGTAMEFDSRLRQEEAYMTAVCGNLDEQSLERDESLCECVLAVPYPGIDCHMPFMFWTLQRMAKSCTNPETHAEALSFCTCVETLDEILGTVEPDTKEARETVQKYDNCTKLGDALFLPTPAQLMTPL